MSPSSPDLPEAYVIACLTHGAWARALDVIEELGPLPGYAPHLASAAERLLAEGQTAAAIRVARRAIELDASCAGAYSTLGRALIDRGSGVGGRGSVKSVGPDPRPPTPDPRVEAEHALRRAMELDADDVAARTALAALYFEQDRPLEARPAIEQALAVAPWDETARAALKRLRKAAEATLPKGDPTAAELHRLAARLHDGSLRSRAQCAVRGAERASRGAQCEVRGAQPEQASIGAAHRAPRTAHASAASLSLCLITRNEARNLPRVIASVRGLATEIIVVDTGSTDETVKIARQLGARVASFAWVDDFAAARNASLELATGEWILVLDADDELARENIPFLRAWLSRGPEAEVVGLYRRYPHPGMQKDSISIQPRLFRNGRGLRFAGAIHEQLVTADGRIAAPEVTVTALITHRADIEDPEAVARRRERNLRILLRTIERDPGDVRARFYAGLTCFENEDWNEALSHLQAVIQAAPADVDFLPKAYACSGDALRELNRPLQAEAALREGLERYPEHPELWFCLGLVLDSLGRLEEAAAAHEAALRGRFGPSLNWHDWSCREAKPHLALSDLRLTLGDPEAAGHHLSAAEEFTGPQPVYTPIREAIAQTVAEQARRDQERSARRTQLQGRFAQGDASAGGELVAAWLESGGIPQAAAIVSKWLRTNPEDPEALMARGQVLLAANTAGEALPCFLKARESRPDCPAAWRGAAEAWRALGQPAEAEEALLHALSLEADGAESARELGELYLSERRWSDAAASFRRAVDAREDLWPAWLGLGKALMRTGNLPAALNCYQRAATLSGGGPAVRIALGEARALLTQAA